MTSRRTPIGRALWRGLRRRCPHCGEGRLFAGWAFFDRCSTCGLVFARNPGDLWAFTILGDRLPIGLMVATIYFGVVRSFPAAGLTLLAGVLGIAIWTSPNRWGMSIALHYLSRVYWPDPADPVPPLRAERSEMSQSPLVFTFYIAAPIEKVWEGFVSKEANRTIFMGADFEIDLRPGGVMAWSGPGQDGKPMRYVTGEVLRADPPTRLEYTFGMGDGAVRSRVSIALTPETEAVKVVVTNDGFGDDDPAYAQNADGWPRILSRLKTLLETGKTFKPH